MPSTIDQRIVQMQFDNQQFESGVSTTLGTLDKLKAALNFDSTKTSLEDIQNASRSFSLDGIGTAVEGIGQKFSVMEIAAMTAIMNITNRLVNMGVQMAKSMSMIEQAGVGWSKYEMKTKAVQTIMNATGQSIDDVTEQLDKLNWFTDETSYSYTSMVNNISKFTNAGVDLKTAVTSMIGIADAAGLAGASVNDASHAMDGFSKAIAQGYMSRMNWQWIKTAHMDTTKFKEILIETAVAEGTLTKAMDGTYKTVKGKTTVSIADFESALKDGWVTTNVMNKALAQFGGTTEQIFDIYQETGQLTSDIIREMGDELDGLGLKAFKASQEAKTFGDAIEAVKDAVSTGWMTSFELMFGNYEESVGFWTDVANILWEIFNASSETRNEILGLWHDMSGGYEAITGGIVSVLEGINNILILTKGSLYDTFIKDNWTFAKSLENVSTKFREFGEIFKYTFSTDTELDLEDLNAEIKEQDNLINNIMYTISGPKGSKAYNTAKRYTEVGRTVEEQLDYATSRKAFLESMVELVSNSSDRIDKLKRTLDGFAAGIDIIKRVLSTIGTIIGKVAKEVLGFGDTILDGTASIGDFLVAVDEWIDKSGILEDLINALSPAIEFLGKVTKTALGYVVDAMKSVLKYISPTKDGLEDLAGTGETKIKPFTKIVEFLSNAFNNLKKIFEKIVPLLKTVGDTIKTLFSEIWGKAVGAVSTGLNNIKGQSTGKLLEEGLGIGLLLQMVEMLHKTLKSMSTFEDLDIKSIPGKILDKLSGTISGALKQLQEALGVWTSGTYLDTLDKFSKSLIVLAGALFIISTIDTDKLLGSVGAMVILMEAMVSVLKSFATISNSLGTKTTSKGLKGFIESFTGGSSQAKQLQQVATSMIAISVALLILAAAVKTLGSMKMEDLIKGLTAVSILVYELLAITNKFSKDEGKILKGAGNLILLAGAIDLLTIAMKVLGGMGWEQIAKGLVGIGVLLGELALFSNLVKGMNLGTAASLLAFGNAMLIISGAMKIIATMNWEEIAKGLTAVGVILGEVAIFSNLIPNPAKMLSGAAGLTIMSAALLLLIPTLKILGGMGLENIAKALIVLGGALTEIAIAASFMQGTIGGAAAMVVFAAALNLLIIPLKVLGAMSLAEIGKALLALAGTFVILGAAGVVLAGLTPILYSLAGAIALLGVGVLAAGAGFLAMTIAIDAFVASAAFAPAAIFTAITAGLEAFILIIPKAVKALADAVVLFVKAAVEIVVAVLDAVIELLPKVGETITAVISTILDILEKNFPNIVKTGLQLLQNLLDGIKRALPQLMKTVIDIVTTFLDTMSANMGKITESGFNLLISFINGMTDSITKNGPMLIDAVFNLIGAVIDTLTGFITNFVETGIECITGVKVGMDQEAPNLFNTAYNIGNSVRNFFSGIASGFVEIGKQIVNGLSNGISSNAPKVTTAVTKLSNGLTNTAKGRLMVKSPSRVFRQIGQYVSEGLALGITDNSSMAEESIDNTSKAIVASMRDALSNVHSMAEENLDVQPKIRPVIDMSDINSNAGMLNKTLGMARNLGHLGASLSTEISSKWDQNSMSDVVTAIESLEYKLDVMGKEMQNLKVVMDTGTLVGEITDPINRSLQQRMIYRERGI